MTSKLSWRRALSIAALSTLWAAVGARAEDQFSVVLLPDTQFYTEADYIHGTDSYYANNQLEAGDVYAEQTKWIVDWHQNTPLNVKFVVSLGDMTNRNIEAQWNVVKGAYARLDAARIPYNVTSGNHDIITKGKKHSGLYRRSSGIDTHFTPEYFTAPARRDWSGYGGAFDGSNQNNYFFFQAGTRKFMVMSLEFAPRKDVVAWANQTIKRFPDRHVILVTHSHLNPNGTYTNAATDAHAEGRSAQDVWNEIGQRHSNIIAILCGHVTGTRTQVKPGLAGNQVLEILSDFQSEPAGGNVELHPKFGNGWLRVLTFQHAPTAAEPDRFRLLIQTTNVFNGKNNTTLFPGGQPALFLTGRYEEPGLIRYISLPANPGYAYRAPADLSFRERLSHKSLLGDHIRPRIDVAANGNFVAVWEDDSDGNGYGQIHARVFDADGAPLTSVITVNTNGDGHQRAPDVAMADGGIFVVVWEDDADGNGYFQIHARGFNADGSERFSERAVNTDGSGQQLAPAVAMAPNGTFVVAWEDDRDGNGFYQVLVRGLTASGLERFADKLVYSSASTESYRPAIEVDGSGNFVVAWEEKVRGDWRSQIYARGFTATGGNRVSAFRLHANPAGTRWNPSVAVDQDGDFVVAWEDDADENGYGQIVASTYGPTGTVRVAEKVINSVAAGHQQLPSAAMDRLGNFVVAWEDDQDNDGTFDIMARSFSLSGTQLRPDFVVNVDTNYDQLIPTVAIDNFGRAFVSWQDDMDEDTTTATTDSASGYNVLVKHVKYLAP